MNSSNGQRYTVTALALLCVALMALIGLISARPSQAASPDYSITAAAPGDTPTPPCPPATLDVAIQDFLFVPPDVSIIAGTTIRWTNYDNAPHTSTSNDGIWDSGLLHQNESYSFTFDTPGVYPYICTPHPWMIGTITVQTGCEPSATPTSTPTATVESILIGHITWQGRPTQPNTRQQLPITVTLKSSSTEVNYSNQTTDASGFFTLPVSGLSSGTYNWRAKSAQIGSSPPEYNPGFLATSGSLVLAGDPVTQAEMGLQRAGDCDNNNVVNSNDFIILKNSFGKTVGQAGYDNRADFTGDLVVNAPDFGSLKNNFGLGGAPPIQAFREKVKP